MVTNSNDSPAIRFWSKVIQGPECWTWRGSVSETGYGSFQYRNRKMGAHRAAYLMHVGEIPTGMIVCHRCDNPSCVRPDHLFVGTHKDNTRDMMAKNRDGFTNRRKTHCPSGHPYAGENLLVMKGRRYCRECRRAESRQRNRKRYATLKALLRGGTV
jgi:hypothetical protein